MMYKVHEAAEIARVSVRTLHYYDQIGLLVPSQKTDAGYRLYSEADIAMLAQIMMLKELGFSLKSIQHLGAENALSDKNVLTAQKTVLQKKIARLKQIISALDSMINNEKERANMDKKDMFSAFDMSEIENAKNQYADEVRKKYPKHLVEEYNTKTSKYSKQDWQRVIQTQGEIFEQFAAHLKANTGIDALQVQDLVRAFQEHINKSFYTCDNQCLSGLGELYVCDTRFTEYYEKIAPGLAQYIRQAIQHYCR